MIRVTKQISVLAYVGAVADMSWHGKITVEA